MNADCSSLTNLTNHSFSDSDPNWSPDGTKIVFMSSRGSPASGGVVVEVYIMNADGSSPSRVTNNGVSEQEPTWGQ